MAQLAVAGGGAAVGAIAGSIIPGVGTVLGAQVGWAIGGIAGALLFPPKGADQNGPRLNDLSVQTSGFGVPIPTVAGRAKLAGNIIWKKDIRERKTTRRQGKGGGGPKVTTYSYFGSWAVGLCEWLIPPVAPGVLRIWLDNKLVYDATGESDTVAVPGLVWRFYPGSETQLPDPLIEATVGASEAPAHRGLAYIVFDDVPLDRFGNRVPNVTVELVGEITRSFPQVATIPPAVPLFASSPSGRNYVGWATNVAIDYARGRIYEGRTRTSGYSTPADELIRVYDLVTMETLGEYPLSTVLAPVFPLGLAPNASNTGTGLMHLGVDGFLYIAGGDANRIPLFKIDPDAMLAVGVWGDLPGPGFGFGGDDLRLINPMQIVSISVPRLNTTPRTFVIVQGSYSATLVIDADDMVYVWGANGVAIEPPIVPIGLGLGPLTYPVLLVPGRTRDDGGVELWYLQGSEGAAPHRIDVVRFRFYSGAANLGGGGAMGIFRDDYTAIDIPALVDASANSVLIQAAYWDFSDDTLVITISGTRPTGVGSQQRFSTFKWSPGGAVVWAVVNHALTTGHDARGQMERVLGGTWGLGGNLLLQTGSGDALVNGAGASFKSLYWLDEQQAVIGFTSPGPGTREVAKRYLSRVAPNTLTVGAVVEALCLRAGLQVSDVNVTALTDPLRGYLLARPMSARDAITPLAAYAQADAVEQDDVILFRKRAGSTVATIVYDDLVRESPDGGVIEEQRAQDADLPREVTVRYADIDRGWEQGAQSWRRPASPTATMQSRGVSAIDLPMPLTATEAKTVARRFCIATWRERTRLSFSVGPRYARLVPTDPITVGLRDGATIRCRILSTQYGANWTTRIEAVTEDAATYALAATGDAGSDWDEPTMPMPYSTRLVVPDLALIEDGDDLAQGGLREYAFACAYAGQRWRGVTVIERGIGAPWDQLGVVTTPVEWGSLIATPPAPGTPWTWDEVGTLRVRMTTGEPESATDLEVLNGANRAALVASDGTAEIVQWRTATQETDGTWTLSGLLRGRRGTEDQIASRRAGDLLLILDGTRLLYDAAIGEAAVSKQLKAVSIFDTPDTAPGLVTKSLRGRAERPYAPASLLASRDGSLNLTLSWVRRTRVGGELLDGTGTVPVSEASEAYEVDIVDGSTVVRTITGLASPGATYTAAQQAADFGGSVPLSVTARVHQMSAIVGRGIPAEITSVRATGISPAGLSFTLQNTTTSWPLMPAALQWCDEPFTADTGQFTLTTEGTIGAFAVTAGNGVVTHTGGGAKSTQVRTDDDLTMPQAWVEVEVVSRTGTGLTFDNFGVGIIKDGDNFMIAQWDRVAQVLRCQIQFGGTNYFYPDVTGFNPTLPFKLALSVVGRSFAVWADTGSGFTVRQRGSLATAPGSPDLRTTTLTGWKAGVSVATSGNATWNFDNLKAGRFGAVGMRDFCVISEENGAPVSFSGLIRFTATCADPNGDSYVGVFELNTSTYALSQVGALMFSRGSGIYNDLNFNIVKTASSNYKVMGATWGNGFGGDLHIRYVETATVITSGSHVIAGTTELNLPNVPNPTTTGGCYDPCFVKDGADWLVAYAVVDPTSFAGENFYVAAARTSDFTTFTGIRADTANTINEGPRIVQVSGSYWIVSGGRGEQLIYEAGMTQVGSSITANVPFYSGTDTQPWMTIVPWSGSFILLTWNNTREGGVAFTWGDLLIYTAPGV